MNVVIHGPDDILFFVRRNFATKITLLKKKKIKMDNKMTVYYFFSNSCICLIEQLQQNLQLTFTEHVLLLYVVYLHFQVSRLTKL